MSALTDQEKALTSLLGAAWDLFLHLPKEHADDVPEFRAAIHRAQHIVLMRPGRRQMNASGL